MFTCYEAALHRDSLDLSFSYGKLWPIVQAAKKVLSANVSGAFKIAGCICSLTAVLVLSGGQWFALQTFAWVRMTVQFAETDTLANALAKTFSGKHPCALCLTVQKGVQEEKEQEQKTPGLQTERLLEVLWDFRCVTAPPVPTRPIEQGSFASCFYSTHQESPPTPPPRA